MRLFPGISASLLPKIFPFTYGKFPQLHCNSRRYHFVIKAHSPIPFITKCYKSIGPDSYIVTTPTHLFPFTYARPIHLQVGTPTGSPQGLTSPHLTSPHLRDSPHLTLSLAGHRRPSKRLPSSRPHQLPGPVVESLRTSPSGQAQKKNLPPDIRWEILPVD